MTQIFSLEQINAVCANLDFSEIIEAGFVAYSNGDVTVPPVGELSFEKPPGDTHIKYGYIKYDDVFVIKIASGFYDNPQLGLPSNSGLMLVFSQKTGSLQAVLLDEGYLTDVRTAVAGQVAAKYLGPKEVSAIGVFGTGIQARMQVEYLKSVTPCRNVIAWGRSDASLGNYQQDMIERGFDVETSMDGEAVASACNLLITATPSREPLISADAIKPGTHITAMGSDTSYKQELDSKILAKADIVVADSLSQCLERGEISRALAAGILSQEAVVELGAIIAGTVESRTSEKQITVADLTGVAVQDIQIAKAVFQQLSR
jgi:ornithine cyclodeaminase